MIFDKNVSFGLEQTRRLGEQDFAAQAWTGEAELEAVGDRRLPAD
jgi:hypothetical protein